MSKVAYCSAHVLISASDRPRHDAAVLVESGLIVAVVGRGEIPAEYRQIRLGRQWLLPGLIDAHVHLVWDGGSSPDDQLVAETPEASALRAAHHAYQHLMNGVTTVRDLGAPCQTILAVRDAIDAGQMTGSRVVAAGNLIGRIGADDPLKVVAADADEARRRVHELVDAGVDLIKLVATGGVFGPGEELEEFDLGPAELAAAVAAAHESGRAVAVHAYSPAGIRNAVGAGADTIEHASFLDADTALEVAAGGQIIVPTLLAYRRYVDLGTDGGLPRRSVDKARRAVMAGRVAMKFALTNGVPIAAGTDGGGRGKPHGWLSAEIGYLIECGMRPADALAAATTVAARTCRLGDAGELTRGRRADIIGVDDDPTSDIRTLSTVRSVIASGRLVKYPKQVEDA